MPPGRSLDDGVRASVLGAGGAARAVIVALASRGAQVTVHARREEQARELAQSFNVGSGAYPPETGSWDLLVNCTPLGGAARRSESPLPAGPLTGRLVYDLTYGAGRSRAHSRCSRRRSRDARRARDAGRAGRAAVRVVDGTEARTGSDGGSGAPARRAGEAGQTPAHMRPCEGA